MKAILWLKLKRMRQDVVMYVIMTLMAIFLTFVFGNAMFGGGGAMRVCVVDNDNSAFSSSFVDFLNNDTYALTDKTQDEAQTLVAKGEALAAIVIPEGFENGITGGGAEVTLLRTADSANILMLENAVRSAYQSAAHIYRLHSELGLALGGIDLDAPSFETVEEEFALRMEDKLMTVSYSILDAGGFDEKFSENIHYMMGFNIFFVMFTIIFSMSSILEDKKLHTWNRIRISPLSSRAVLAGNFIPAYGVGMLQMAIVLFLGQMLFGINLGSALLPVFGVFAAFVLAASCLGLLLATVFKGIEQMGAAVPVIIVGTSMLGGCMWPLSIVGSDVLIGIAKAMPQYWALEAAKTLAVYHRGMDDVVLNIGVLLGMAIVLFAVSILLYNKKQRV